MAKPWIGVDLDGTLAHYDGWKGIEHIGEPIAPMVRRVRLWLRNGSSVRIFTARVSPGRAVDDRLEATRHIQDWCERHVGQRLPVTCVKDFDMLELWDDRAVAVQHNTGKVKFWAR